MPFSRPTISYKSFKLEVLNIFDRNITATFKTNNLRRKKYKEGIEIKEVSGEGGV